MHQKIVDPCFLPSMPTWCLSIGPQLYLPHQIGQQEHQLHNTLYVGTVLIIDSMLIMEPNIFAFIFSKEVIASMYIVQDM